ncbi:hypothetical protein PQ472_00355 [Lacticaseibacillus pabuli]|uniref:Uncharacterized protein n=1 Tax=Lacticaseibacillus pabuli TaxID=3025672 RepID=A0ABY7WRA3_9LACO|nr:hypothetical protein [Lacticaseibacillus sp. KACC 23028]WDF82724.1 hypothetical protein PQ472_00355 [Lacticaseibacillus sp. KACC 23028]
MNVFTALQLIHIDHADLNQRTVIITDEGGKPDSVLSGLLSDVLTNIAIFADIKKANSPLGLIDQLRSCTPLPADVLDEYQKLLEQEIAGVNFAAHKGIVELVYKPLI